MVSVGPGVPSAEGPRASAAAESWSFRTFGPFRVRRSECGWRGRCTPSDPWRIELTNPIDAKSLRKDLVRIEPELSGLKLESWGETLAIRGLPRGRARYRVALGTALRDVFGQELEPGPELALRRGPRAASALRRGRRLRRARSHGRAVLPGLLDRATPRCASRRTPSRRPTGPRGTPTGSRPGARRVPCRRAGA